MMLYLQKYTPVGHSPVRLLHVAPDYGLYLWLQRQAGLDYVGSDIDAYRYRHIRGIRKEDLTATSFADASFDIVVCSHVLEHVPDDQAAFKEIARILKPGGTAILLTPYATDENGTDEDPSILDPAERDRRFGQWDHVRLYDRDTFLQRMSAVGFETSLYDPFLESKEVAEVLHLNPMELLPIGRKPNSLLTV
jgi:SAM-dependent methyltransferase